MQRHRGGGDSRFQQGHTDLKRWNTRCLKRLAGDRIGNDGWRTQPCKPCYMRPRSLAKGLKPYQKFWSRVPRLLAKRTYFWTSILEALPGMALGACQGLSQLQGCSHTGEDKTGGLGAEEVRIPAGSWSLSKVQTGVPLGWRGLLLELFLQRASVPWIEVGTGRIMERLCGLQ